MDHIYLGIILFWILFRAGIPTVDGNGHQSKGPVPGPANNSVFPPVLKDEAPSVHILRYMDGITKRVQKLQEAWKD